jgi:hypothetical protein
MDSLPPTKNTLEFHEMHAMDPVEKFQRYNRFPYKMIIHMLLLIFTTCQVVLKVSESNKYSRSQERFLYNMFIDESDKRATDYNKIAYLYTAEDIKNHVQTSISNFFNLNTKSLEIVQLPENGESVIMEFTYIDNQRVKDLIVNTNIDNNLVDNINMNINNNNYFPKNNVIPRRFDYEVTTNNLGPFNHTNNNDIREFLNEVVEFRLNYTLKTYVPFYYNNNYDCNLWSIIQHYNFASRAHFVVKLNIERLSCQDFTGDHSYLNLFINKLLWIDILVLILAIVSLIMTWRYIQGIATLFMRVKSKHKQRKKKEDEDALFTGSEDSIYYNPLIDEDLRKQKLEEIIKVKEAEKKYSRMGPGERDHDDPSSQKRDVNFNMWSLICLVGNIIQIFASAISVFDTKNILAYSEILVGFGCFFAYINIGRYIEYAENYSTIYITIKNAMPNVFRYLFGVFPIFLGFIFFGLCVFWRSERFTSTSNVMIILFSLAQGDSVFDTFKDLSGIYFFIGQAYLYLFCLIFIV